MTYSESSDDGLREKLHLAVKYFNSGAYSDVVAKALECYNRSDIVGVDKALSKLPSKEKLLRDLLKALAGKSVIKTWNRVLKGNIDNKYTEMKALFSLGTHLSIELEKGNGEYLMLLEDIYTSISKALII
jgi:hypothetical protein